ncbi:hypothetical protein [Spiroplasma endosymbiont of Labia minor]|uniref:hypothetical protein n=1 Tax=Spiroplasma endosymbiont of Labia minor TaxID=3066305 RepID=UPI0030CD15A8
MQLALCATDLGYGSTIMAGIKYNELTKTFKENNWLKENENICLAVLIGTNDDKSNLNRVIQNNKWRIPIEDLVTEIK